MTTTRANFWSVTINNPSEADYECINLARQKGWEVHGQLEMGKEGTRHYQMMVKTPQVRFSAVKKTFPRAHIEVARNVSALKQYVNKEETRVGDLPTQQEKYPSVSKLWELIHEYFTSDDKDCLDYWKLADGEVVFFRDSREALFQTKPLVLFDEAIASLIKHRGYFVEHHACNPQVRQQWKLFAREILWRTEQIRRKKRETDRQTDSVQSAEILVVGENTTTQDADDSSRSQTSEGLLGEVNEYTEGSCTSAGSSDEEGSDEDC